MSAERRRAKEEVAAAPSSSRSPTESEARRQVAAAPSSSRSPTESEARRQVAAASSSSRSPRESAAQRQFAAAQRVLVIGIGGGGDVAGALAAAEAVRALGTEAVVGGLTWERRPVDPLPGPRRLSEITGAQPLHEAVALAGPDTTGPGGFRFCEADMSAFLGEPVVLVDPNPGPAAIAAGLDAAAAHLGCDLVALLDVGGDVLAHGDEPGLASPLADATVLAAAPRMATPTIAMVFGIGCDGELTPGEVAERLAEVAAAGGDLGDLVLPATALDRVEAALATVTTEASAMAIRCARGETGRVPIRGGRRTVPLTADGGLLVCLDPAITIASAARLAAAVGEAADLEAAQAILTGLGVRTELDYEREAARAQPA